MNEDPLIVGRYLPLRAARDVQINCDDPKLRWHASRPWLRAYVGKQLGQSLATGAARRSPQGRASIPSDALARHGFVAGATGGGKSRALIHLLLSQLQAGCSVVAIDPKGELVDRLLAHVVADGFPSEQIVLLDPTREDVGPPGFNPLLTGLPLVQAASDVMSVIERASSNWGPRLGDILYNVLILVGTHRLSLFELARFLSREDYREALLGLPVQAPDPLAFGEAVSFFRHEMGAWGKAERAGAASPVLNKLRVLLQSPFLRPMLCARENSLDLASLWRERKLVLVRLDRSTLGDDGSRLLAGLITNLLLRVALRGPGAGPVVLAIDELPLLERYVGAALNDLLAVARSQHLRCLVAFQHLEQLSDSLRASLLGNCACQLLFRSGPADARLAAGSLALGGVDQIQRLSLSVDREDRSTGEVPAAVWRHPVRDASGQPLRLRTDAWDAFCSGPREGAAGLGRLVELAVASGARRLYVRAPDTGEPVELLRYTEGLSAAECWIEGPSLQLAVSFPRPRISGVVRTSEADAVRTWSRCLQELPIQHAVMRVAGRPPGVVRVVDVPTPTVGRLARERLIRGSVARNGQSSQQMAADIAWRTAQIERLVQGPLVPGKEVTDDSLF